MEKKHISKLIFIMILIVFVLFVLATYSQADEEEFWIESGKYLVLETNSYISRIIPQTTVNELKQNFNVEADQIHIFKDQMLQEEVTDGYVTTGMFLTCDKKEKSYELSVIGDIDENGDIEQIDLNLLIKHIVGLKTAQLDGISVLSADLSGDGEINQLDITILIRYIISHELYVPEIKRPSAPMIEVINAEEGVENWYNQDLKISIKEDENSPVPIGKTVYKLVGSGITEETEIQKEAIVNISGEVEYEIIAYSYSEEGAKSETSKKTVKIDKGAPELTIYTITNQNNIEVQSHATDNRSGIRDYTYYIGEKDEDGSVTWSEGFTTSEESYTFTNLSEEKEYNIKVIARDKAGNTTTKETVNIGKNSDPIQFILSDTNWTNQPVTVTVKHSNPQNTLKTSLDGSKWEETTTYTLEANGVVYAKLEDGINTSSIYKVDVANIDTTQPTVTIENTEKTTKLITMKANVKDDLSGLGEIQWHFLKEGDEQENVITKKYCKVNGPEAGKLETVEEQSDSNFLTGTYHVYAEVIDVAGNKTKTETKDVILDTLKSAQGVIKLTQNITYWTNEEVTVTATSLDKELILQTSMDGTHWTEETTRILTQNGTVYARLSDGVNGGEAASITVNNIDIDVPQVEDITSRVEDTKVNLSIPVKDPASGIAKVEWQYKLSSESDYTVETDHYMDLHGTTAGIKSRTMTKTLSLVKGETYDIVVMIYDVAGNFVQKTTTISI